MADARGLLADPPAPLIVALGGMNQGLGLPCQVEKAAMPEYLLDFVGEGDHASLLRYLDDVLGDANVTDAALLALFNRAGPNNYFDEAHEARTLFTGLRRELRKQMKHHG